MVNEITIKMERHALKSFNCTLVWNQYGMLSIDTTWSLDAASLPSWEINSWLVIIAWEAIGKIISSALTPTPHLVGSRLISDLCIRMSGQWSWWEPAAPPFGFACSCRATRPPPSVRLTQRKWPMGTLGSDQRVDGYSDNTSLELNYRFQL